MQNMLKGIGRRLAKRVAVETLSDIERDAIKQCAAATKIQQISLAMRYRELARAGGPMPAMADVGFRVYSQSDEDGILLYLFSLIGSPTKKAIEICAGDGIECNTANLLIHHGWTGLLVDGSPELVERGRIFYARHPDTMIWPPTFAHSWVTRDNVNALVRDQGFAGEIDLLSIDLDGVDYWIWEALDCITPRVVVVEYQDIWGPDEAVTVPYMDDFRSQFTSAGPNYCGASLAAFNKLANRKGYRLVAINKYGYNAFFVRNGMGDALLPEIPVSACFNHPKVIAGMRDRLATVKDREWVRV